MNAKQFKKLKLWDQRKCLRMKDKKNGWFR